MDLLPSYLMILLALTSCVGGALWYKFFLPLRHLSSGEQRRQAFPPGASYAEAAGMPMPAGPIPVPDDQLKISHGFYKLKKATIAGETDGQIFYSQFTPANAQVEIVIAIVHGFSEHHSGMLLNMIRAYCVTFNACVIAFDMPAHGRSDGLFVYMPDWFEFCGAAEEVIEQLALPQCKALSTDPAKPLKLMIQGLSMGGGVCATLAIQRPDMVDGMILEAPMLFVSDDIKPHWIIVSLFRHVIIKISILMTWPVAPSKDITSKAYSDPTHISFNKANPLAYSSKPRLASACLLQRISFAIMISINLLLFLGGTF